MPEAYTPTGLFWMGLTNLNYIIVGPVFVLQLTVDRSLTLALGHRYSTLAQRSVMGLALMIIFITFIGITFVSILELPLDMEKEGSRSGLAQPRQSHHFKGCWCMPNISLFIGEMSRTASYHYKECVHYMQSVRLYRFSLHPENVEKQCDWKNARLSKGTNGPVNRPQRSAAPLNHGAEPYRAEGATLPLVLLK
ncbi:hypothetical protein DdX_22329 [Ditylenchus destructor]|uniref:Uncharacterized protein n=1 Tax=Ditylenchus destructor TaxID=166010 RepID=A0AAD4MFX5_9BILA|nr:hypothetical protein DdX_22329 [Ditylenchus destructor]